MLSSSSKKEFKSSSGRLLQGGLTHL